jgi:hypothetical protein
MREFEQLPPEKLTKDELYEEIVEIAGLPEKETTGSYTFRREHLVELVRHLRREGGQDA